MADETSVGGNAVENIMKKNLKVKVSRCYRKKISKRNLKHVKDHKHYSSRVYSIVRAYLKAKEIKAILIACHQNNWIEF